MLCSKTIYIKEKKSTNGRLKKKTVTTIATVPLSTVATIRNFKKKKKRQSTSPNFHCRWTVKKSGMNGA